MDQKTLQSKKELTPEQIAFIKANYLEVSMIEMASKLNSNTYQVKKIMLQNNLVVTAETVQKFKQKNRAKRYRSVIPEQKEIEDYKNTDWVFDFWNHGLNPIVMATLTNKSIF
jgi:nicotinic acid mononucleotide adenylyltransferase